MSKTVNTKAQIESPAQTPGDKKSLSTLLERLAGSYFLDVLIVVAMGTILFWGISTQFPNRFNDATRYQCYAIAFWQGTPGLHSLPPQQCAFLAASSTSSLAQKLQARHFPSIVINLVKWQNTSQPLHALPPEYPVLTILPFTLGLIAPQQDYEIAFAIWMALVAAIIYFVLKKYRSLSAGIAFAFYLCLGSWVTAEGRFDLIPAGLTLGAVILAGRAKWRWAFALLALATMLKFYPVVLLLPLFLAQQMQNNSRWNSLRRWDGLGIFIAVCAVATALSLLLNAADTLMPLRYFLNRPIQVESLPASLLWLAQFIGYPVQYPFTYQSLNILSPLSSKVSLLSDLLLVAGLVYTLWLQWKGKLDIYTASLLTLLILIITGKVFSPQYLIWVAPLMAYVGKSNWKWLISWGLVGLLTTIDFPFIYVDLPHILKYYPVILTRNLIILVIVCGLLYYATRKELKANPGSAQPQTQGSVSEALKG